MDYGEVIAGKELEAMPDEVLFDRVRTVPLTAGEWLSIMMVALSVVVVVEIDKWIRRKRPSPL